VKLRARQTPTHSTAQRIGSRRSPLKNVRRETVLPGIFLEG
jgi:hypothetical protein